jgi:hypothetical protein
MTCPGATVDRVVDGGVCAEVPHAAASSATAGMNQQMRTPVDTTE